MISTSVPLLILTHMALDYYVEVDKPVPPKDKSKISGNSDGPICWAMVLKMGFSHMAALYGAMFHLSMNWKTILLTYVFVRMITFGYVL
jgi:hypothetical protein